MSSGFSASFIYKFICCLPLSEALECSLRRSLTIELKEIHASISSNYSLSAKQLKEAPGNECQSRDASIKVLRLQKYYHIASIVRNCSYIALLVAGIALKIIIGYKGACVALGVITYSNAWMYYAAHKIGENTRAIERDKIFQETATFRLNELERRPDTLIVVKKFFDNN